MFNVEEATEKLLKLYQQFKAHDHGGVLGDTTPSSANSTASKTPFSFSITYALERKLTGKKLKRAIDDYYDLSPGTTKSIKTLSLFAQLVFIAMTLNKRMHEQQGVCIVNYREYTSPKQENIDEINILLL